MGDDETTQDGTPEYYICIVCTDRGQHGGIRLTTARKTSEERGMSFALEHFAPPMADAEPRSMIGHDSYTFICPRCGRTPQIQRERWWRIVDAAAEEGMDELDISRLPF
ncbi:hypothetical protein GCM10023347_47030 [Streptomyces chumphonensis]